MMLIEIFLTFVIKKLVIILKINGRHWEWKFALFKLTRVSVNIMMKSVAFTSCVTQSFAVISGFTSYIFEENT